MVKIKLKKRIIIIAILLAGLTTYGVYYYIQSILSNTKYKDVIVARMNIPAKTMVDQMMIVQKKIDERYILKNAITDAAIIIGKYTNESIMEGEQILSDRLSAEDKTRFAYKVPKEMRAVTIAVDSVSGIDDMIKSGDYVDIFAFIPQEETADKSVKVINPNIAKLILQKVLVLAIDTYDSSLENGATPVNTKTTQDKFKEITLALKTTDVEKLIISDDTGKIRLGLRNPEDDGTYNTSGAIRKDIVP